MNRTAPLLLAVATIVAGAAIAVVIGDDDFLIFTGRPFGVVLAIVGVLELAALLARRRDD